MNNKHKRGTRERALEDLSNMFDRYTGTKKEKLLAYWLSQYANFMKQEETFKPQKLKRYRRGEIIKANLGYRLGSEQGGMHYAIVLDVDNSVYSDIITILPLSSKKLSTKITKYTVDLKDEVYRKLNEKYEAKYNNATVKLVIDPEVAPADTPIKISFSMDTTEIDKIQKEIDSMKQGSIALLSQITTISKMRIEKPLRTTDALSDIRLSNESLDLIDSKIMELYIGKKQKKQHTQSEE